MRAYLALALAGALAAAPVAAINWDRALTAEEKRQCNAGGGCIVATRQWVNEIVDAAREAGRDDARAEARQQCGSRT